MKNTNFLENLLVIVISLLPFGYLAYIFPSLPDQVPMHYGINGQPDRFGAKSELWVATSILMIVGLGTYLLLINLHRIDPKKTAGTMQETVRKIALSAVVLISALDLFILHSTLKGGMGGNTIFLLVGLFIAYIGNLMHSVKPNYFVGIRLPWTLENETNWRKTHQFAAKFWVIGGLLVAVLALFSTAAGALYAMIAVLVITTFVPVVYSYRLYRQMNA